VDLLFGNVCPLIGSNEVADFPELEPIGILDEVTQSVDFLWEAIGSVDGIDLTLNPKGIVMMANLPCSSRRRHTLVGVERGLGATWELRTRVPFHQRQNLVKRRK